MWNLEKWQINIFAKQKETQCREKKYMDTKGGDRGWEELGDWD